MGVYNYVPTLSRRQEKLFKRGLEHIADIPEFYMKDMSKKILPMVSGTISDFELSFIYFHPFSPRRAYSTTGVGASRRRGMPGKRVPLLPINVQTGELRSSYTITRTTSAGSVEWQGFFSSPHAEAFGPSTNVIDRGYGDWLAATIPQAINRASKLRKKILW